MPRPPEAAGRAALLAQETGAPYPTARHLGQRLVAEEAQALGWGDPERWLREAEHHFHETSATAVVGACRTLRAIGTPVRRHRTGSDLIPPELRLRGMTVREYEIFRLLADRPSNKDIAARLYVSPRTVEKHVAGLIAKTGLLNRSQLCALAAAGTPDGPAGPR